MCFNFGESKEMKLVTMLSSCFDVRHDSACFEVFFFDLSLVTIHLAQITTHHFGACFIFKTSQVFSEPLVVSHHALLTYFLCSHLHVISCDVTFLHKNFNFSGDLLRCKLCSCLHIPQHGIIGASLTIH